MRAGTHPPNPGPRPMPATDPNATAISMTERAKQLHAIADRQIAELIDLISTLDQAALGLPCPGRKKLGDGTLGAAARHTADNYERIAAFAQAPDHRSNVQRPAQHDGHRTPRLPRRIGHRPTGDATHGPAGGQHRDQYTADTMDVDIVLGQLSASRKALGAIAGLTDSQLDSIPPRDSVRFCDGQRTLEQVLASLLTHQGHQVDALKTARL
jgi:hypothetical protein